MQKYNPKSKSNVVAAHVLSKVLKIEPALFLGNRSYATVLFHASIGCLYLPASLGAPKINLCMWKQRNIRHDDVIMAQTGAHIVRQKRGWSLEFTLPFRKANTGRCWALHVRLHGNRRSEDGTALKHCRSDGRGGEGRWWWDALEVRSVIAI